MSVLSSKPSNPDSKNAHAKYARKPAKLKVLSRYVKLNALLAIVGAVIGLWALQLVFSYLSELDSLDDSYTMGEAIKYIFSLALFFRAIYSHWRIARCSGWLGLACQ